jgi:hypothetical protein
MGKDPDRSAVANEVGDGSRSAAWLPFGNEVDQEVPIDGYVRLEGSLA